LYLFPDKVTAVPKLVKRIVFALAGVNAGVDFPNARQSAERHCYD
jgi:hypothetical protein